MSSIFDGGRPVALADVLATRDWRQARQAQLMANRPGAVIVSLKLNIPGPVKASQALTAVFEHGWTHFAAMAPPAVEAERAVARATGPEGFLVVAGRSVEAVKRDAICFEETDTLGRLFDIDVMADGKSLSRTALGFPQRRCYVCERPAKDCARAQRHSAADIRKAIDDIYQKATR